MPSTPACGLSAKALTISSETAICSAVGVKTSLMISTWFGWMAILPVNPSRAASVASTRRPAASRKLTNTVSIGCAEAAAAVNRHRLRAS